MMSLLKLLLLKSENFFLSSPSEKNKVSFSSETKLTKLTFSYLFSKINELKESETQLIMIK